MKCRYVRRAWARSLYLLYILHLGKLRPFSSFRLLNCLSSAEKKVKCVHLRGNTHHSRLVNGSKCKHHGSVYIQWVGYIIIVVVFPSLLSLPCLLFAFLTHVSFSLHCSPPPPFCLDPWNALNKWMISIRALQIYFFSRKKEHQHRDRATGTGTGERHSSGLGGAGHSSLSVTHPLTQPGRRQKKKKMVSFQAWAIFPSSPILRSTALLRRDDEGVTGVEIVPASHHSGQVSWKRANLIYLPAVLLIFFFSFFFFFFFFFFILFSHLPSSHTSPPFTMVNFLHRHEPSETDALLERAEQAVHHTRYEAHSKWAGVRHKVSWLEPGSAIISLVLSIDNHLLTDISNYSPLLTWKNSSARLSPSSWALPSSLPSAPAPLPSSSSRPTTRGSPCPSAGVLV